jgi:hypothetical protein
LKLLSEHEFEPVPGLPEKLPAGEFIRWQGRPDWRDLAISAMHVRKLCVYFAALLLLRVVLLLREGLPVADIVTSTLILGCLASVALGLLSLMAWLMARASLYTLTNRRLVIRSGVALPMTVNLPFSRIISADLRQRSRGFGDISLTLSADSQASWVVLWPHVRPWYVGRVQPMLRALPESESVAGVLGEALRDFMNSDTDPARRLQSRSSQDLPVVGSTLHGVH